MGAETWRNQAAAPGSGCLLPAAPQPTSTLRSPSRSRTTAEPGPGGRLHPLGRAPGGSSMLQESTEPLQGGSGGGPHSLPQRPALPLTPCFSPRRPSRLRALAHPPQPSPFPKALSPPSRPPPAARRPPAATAPRRAPRSMAPRPALGPGRAFLGPVYFFFIFFSEGEALPWLRGGPSVPRAGPERRALGEGGPSVPRAGPEVSALPRARLRTSGGVLPPWVSVSLRGAGIGIGIRIGIGIGIGIRIGIGIGAAAAMKDVPGFLQQSQSSGPGQAAVWHRLEELYNKK
ncbi:hypothetical protein LUU34_00823900 [Aix galericulata]|nr:hypothetical protein LUU34_00823900 [Aix galericulata]